MKISKRRIVGCVCILAGLLLICIYFVFMHKAKVTKLKGNSIYQDIVFNEDDDFVYLDKDFVKVLQETFNNENIIGYVVYDEANISYPIVKSEDNIDYLYKDLYGNYNASGSIFLDYGNSIDFSDTSSVLYGHHMNNGSMFGSLEKHINEKGINKSESIYIYTKDARLEYSCIASEVFDPEKESSSRYLVSNNEEDFFNWLNYVSKDCILKEVKQKDRFLTLVTCHYSGITVDRFGLTGKYVGSKKYKVKGGE